MLLNPTPQVDFIPWIIDNLVNCFAELFSLNLSSDSPGNREKLIHLAPLKNLPTAAATENNNRVEMPVDDAPLTPGVLSSDRVDGSLQWERKIQRKLLVDNSIRKML